MILAGMLTACTDHERASAAAKLKHDKVLRYDVNAPFASLHPAAVKASGSTHIFPLLYSYLFVPNSAGELEPDLAKTWRYDANRLEWTIHLKDGAMFHDGRPVTAGDVTYSYETMIPHLRPGLDRTIEKVLPLSESALRIRLKWVDPSILHKLWDIEIFPKFDDETIRYDLKPIGSGPFKFSTRKNSQIVTLDANTYYYGGAPKIDRIVFNYQPDREKAWARLLSGTTDIAQEVSPKNYQLMQHYKNLFYFDTYPLNFYTILLYNTYDPLFSDIKTRKALTLGIDRFYIVNNILKGFGRIATGPMGIDSPYNHPKVQPLPYNPAQAMKLLKEVGWRHDGNGRLIKNGKPFEFTILVYQENQIEKKVAAFIQLCLNNMGIKASLQALSYEEVKQSYYQNNQFQCVLTELESAYRQPGRIKKIWSHGEHGKSYAGGLDSSEVNRLIEKALSVSDRSEKKELFRKLDRLIVSLQPGTFLFHKTATDVMSRRFKLTHPFSLTHEGIYQLKNASIIETTTP